MIACALYIFIINLKQSNHFSKTFMRFIEWIVYLAALNIALLFLRLRLDLQIFSIELLVRT